MPTFTSTPATPIPETANLWSTEETREAPYTTYSMSVTYLNVQGRIQTPVAGPPGTPCEVIQVSAPTGVKVVSWTAARDGAVPTVPDPATVDPNNILLSYQITPAVPVLMANGQNHRWLMSGVYY